MLCGCYLLNGCAVFFGVFVFCGMVYIWVMVFVCEGSFFLMEERVVMTRDVVDPEGAGFFRKRRSRRWTGKQSSGKRVRPDPHSVRYAPITGEPLGVGHRVSLLDVERTPKGRLCLRLLASGLSTKQVSERTGLCVSTVRRYRNHPDGQYLIRRMQDLQDELMCIERAIDDYQAVRRMKARDGR